MPFSILGKNAMLNALGALAVYASLHSADPGENGANELTGGSPAYARKAITWSAADEGAMDDSNIPAFNVPAGSTVLYVGLWSHLTVGTFYGSNPVTQENFTAQGTYTLTDMDLDLNT